MLVSSRIMMKDISKRDLKTTIQVTPMIKELYWNEGSISFLFSRKIEDQIRKGEKTLCLLFKYLLQQ